MNINIPNWYEEYYSNILEYTNSLVPFPFSNNDSKSKFIELNQNDYLRLGNSDEVINARHKENYKNIKESFISSVFGLEAESNEEFKSIVKKVMKADDVLLTTSGWASNVGLIEAITPTRKPIYIDNYAHASLFDGVKLSLGKKIVIKHNDVVHLEEMVKRNGPGIIVIDALYSTTGDIAPLEDYIKISEKYECILVVDEAHSFGLFGKGGGLCVELGLEQRVHFRTVSLNKALGGHGGLIVSNSSLMDVVKARCRSIIFSSATSRVAAAGHIAAIQTIIDKPELIKRCHDNADFLKQFFKENFIETEKTDSQIISFKFESEKDACEFYSDLKDSGILTSVFVYPAIPKGMGLVRLSIHSDLDQKDLNYICKNVKKLYFSKKGVKSE